MTVISDSAAELEELRRQVAERDTQLAAISNILRTISSSPGDLSTVLRNVAEQTCRLCDADDASVMTLHGDALRIEARFHANDDSYDSAATGTLIPLDRGFVTGRAVLDRSVVHIHDLAAVPEAEMPATPARLSGIRTGLAVPLLKKGAPIGALGIRRRRVQPFTDQQIALVRTFADQAVIAIENAHLLTQLQESNHTLTESLEQQTATSEILRIIAASPTDVGQSSTRSLKAWHTC